MRALVFGVDADPDVSTPPEGANDLVRGLATTPMRVMEVEEPVLAGDDWVLTRPRLSGICGSDAKQVFGDWDGVNADNPMIAFVSFPQVLGHEVVADVVAVGDDVTGVDVGDRVCLDPWLGCAPRGIDPPCPACATGDFSLCWNFTRGRLSQGIHTGNSSDAPGGYAELMPAHESMLHRVPDGLAEEQAVLADPFAVSLHAVTRHPPPPGGRALVYGAGSLGICTTAILRALHPDVEVMVVARFPAQAAFVAALGAETVAHEPAVAIVEEVTRWSGGTLVHPGGEGLPMAYPGGIDVVYDTVGKRETFEVGSRVLASRGTLVKAGVHGPTFWEDTPLYFKELTLVGSNAFGFETVRGVRRHGIAHALDLLDGDVDLSGMVTHTFPLEAWRDAFATLAEQDRSGAIKVAFDFRSS